MYSQFVLGHMYRVNNYTNYKPRIINNVKDKQCLSVLINNEFPLMGGGKEGHILNLNSFTLEFYD